jgi:uncharacterized SAM-binding protein YcdF (DUF218 family)
MKHVALFVCALLSLAPAHAANFTVTSLNDNGAGSLRGAIAQANVNPGADTIDFAVTGTIVLTGGQLQIDDALTITCPGAASLVIDANGASVPPGGLSASPQSMRGRRAAHAAPRSSRKG